MKYCIFSDAPPFLRQRSHFRAKLYLSTFTEKNPIVPNSLKLYMDMRLIMGDYTKQIYENITSFGVSCQYVTKLLDAAII